MHQSTKKHSPFYESYVSSTSYQFICLTFFIISLLSVLFVSKPAYAEGVVPSHKKILQPGQTIADYIRLQIDKPYTLQRLSKNTYWVGVKFYCSIFYVGKNGVLLFDPLGTGQAPHILAAIAKVTDLPVTALVYSHSRQDHIGGAKVIRTDTDKRDAKLRIIATDLTNKQLTPFSTADIPLPTDVIKTPVDEFTFEQLLVKVKSPMFEANSNGKAMFDSSIFYLPSEKVINTVDIIKPDDLPYKNFRGITNIKAYRVMVKDMLAMDWNFLSGGHFNIGTPETLKGYLKYIDDVEAAVDEAKRKSASFSEYINRDTPVVSWIIQREQDLISNARTILEPKYGHIPTFKYVVDGHIAGVKKQ